MGDFNQEAAETYTIPNAKLNDMLNVMLRDLSRVLNRATADSTGYNSKGEQNFKYTVQSDNILTTCKIVKAETWDTKIRELLPATDMRHETSDHSPVVAELQVH